LRLKEPPSFPGVFLNLICVMAPAVIPSTAGAAIEQAAHQMAQQPAAVNAEPGPQPRPVKKSKAGQDYKGFVAGVFSGMAKVSGMRLPLPGDGALYYDF
jgi:hypothetical protein